MALAPKVFRYLGSTLIVILAAGTSAGVVAIAMGRGDVRLPSILAGSLGNAAGTYAGFVIAEL